MTDRYHRHGLIDWFSQEALSHTKVAVVGAGAVGNEVIKNLSLLGVGEIHVFDIDLIEEHNLTRSVLFRDTDIGQAKAEVASRRAREMDPNIVAKGIFGDFWHNLRLLDLREYDLLFCCVDNFEARIRCNTLCHLAGVDMINVGIDSRFAMVEMFPFSHAEKGCFECNLPVGIYGRISERYSCGHLRKLSFVERKIPTTIITSSAAASLAVSTGLRLGRNDGDEPVATRLYLDTIGGSLTRTSLAALEGCPCCGMYSRKPLLTSSGRRISDLPASLDGSATVCFSEPLLASFRVHGKETIVFQRADKFDSDFPASVAADPGIVELEVRDQFALVEIVNRFHGRLIPSKFAAVTIGDSTIIFEFTGDPS